MRTVPAEDLDVLIVASITRYVGGLRMQLEPPLSSSLKEALGARRAMSFDLSNACAGMMTGVFLLNDLIRQGRIRLRYGRQRRVHLTAGPQCGPRDPHGDETSSSPR